MGMLDVIQNVKQKLKEANTPERIYSDEETRDKYLRSLRRERRTQLEEVEKEKLQKVIGEYKKQRTKRHVYGADTTDAVLKKEKLTKKQNLLIKKLQKQRIRQMSETVRAYRVREKPKIILSQSFFGSSDEFGNERQKPKFFNKTNL